MAKAKTTRARVLGAVTIAGKALSPNDVVDVDDKTLKAHADVLDAAPEAAEAALKSGGAEIQLPPADEPGETEQTA